MKILFPATVITLVTLVAAAKAIAAADVGLHIEFSEIKDTFHRHLTKYTGDCPGESWSGVAQDGDLRFIDHNFEPNKQLKVNLINVSTGKKITRDYKKIQRGSNDFTLKQLGNSDGEHNIEYQIYDKSSKETIATGNFTYTVTSSEETKQRDAQWKLELYCESDSSDKLKDCDTLGSRKVKYCNGSRTSDVYNQRIFNLDRTTVEIDL
ncbi:hypothetical protein Xen7305DRAFT_00042940 [Xenococcus sp. PCC 7305]|uniref:hypothetical protein n=1 Tax=Xenococcus sp. PCC 7305 TaxID=102125 RepID=UPI0002ACCD0B|nr:hypothetical protein [Xenococcus sp. PCC 7305]ELS04559.1 hypothetical protein Xen7305DRAFT_00042940 [Xenococcus sp. PCC 7305]